ncbi:MAG: hypothetical protein GXX79_11360 [Actinomycetales bacterium]|nr:hypothetical protein [Actinomycetales bacterium]
MLTASPSSLVIHGREVGGLPRRAWSLDVLRAHLLSAATPRPVRDATWRYLIERARRDGPAWVIGCVGVAMPGLRRAAARLAPGWPGQVADLDAELLTGFLERLHGMDLDGPRVCGRLIDAGVRAARAAREAECGQAEVIRALGATSLAPVRPWDHPDWVLARAQAAAVISAEEHLLIGATRLEDVPLAEVAARLEVTCSYASTWRSRCEARLARAIADGDVDWIRTRHRRTGGDPAIPRTRAELAAMRALDAALSDPCPEQDSVRDGQVEPHRPHRAHQWGPGGVEPRGGVSCGAPHRGLGDGDRSDTTPRTRRLSVQRAGWEVSTP